MVNIKIKGIILLVIFILCADGFTQESKTEKLFLITMDGLRWQELFYGADSQLVANENYVSDPETLRDNFWRDTGKEHRETLMPFFWSVIAERGQIYGNRRLGSKVNVTNRMLFSYPGYSEILTGFSDDKNIDSNDKIPNPNKTFLEFINDKSEFNGNVAAFASWGVFPFIINEERSGIPVNAGYETVKNEPNEKELLINRLQLETPRIWETVRLDAFTHHIALEYVKEHYPRVVYIGYGETDDFAHDGRYDQYLRAAHRTDQFIRELWDYVQSDPYYRNKTTFLITTDHGRGTTPLDDWRNHGSDIEGADEIWIAALGPDTPALGDVTEGQYYQDQIAKTCVFLLGLKYRNNKKVGKAIRPITGR